MYQRTIVVGTLGKDAVTTELSDGETVVNFSIAVSKRREDEEPVWWRCSIWGAAAKYAGTLKKGDRVLVEGTASAEIYMDQVSMKLSAYTVQGISRKDRFEEGPTAKSSPPEVPEAGPEDDDDLTF